MHNAAEQNIFNPLPHTGVRRFRPSFQRGLEPAPEVFYPGPESRILQQMAKPLDPGFRRGDCEKGNHWTPAFAGVIKRTGLTKKTGVAKKTGETKRTGVKRKIGVMKKAGATRKISFCNCPTKKHICFDRHSGESRNPESIDLLHPYIIHLTPYAVRRIFIVLPLRFTSYSVRRSFGGPH